MSAAEIEALEAKGVVANAETPILIFRAQTRC